MTVLVEVRCAERGGKCGILLATATSFPPPNIPDGLVAFFLNASGKNRQPSGWARRENVVPSDYSGGARVPACVCDSRWRKSREGYFPFRLLRDAIPEALRTGRTQVVTWASRQTWHERPPAPSPWT